MTANIAPSVSTIITALTIENQCTLFSVYARRRGSAHDS